MMDACNVPTAPRPLREWARGLENQTGFVDVLAELRAGRTAAFDGVVGSSCALLAVALLKHAPGPLVVVCHSEDMADTLAEDTRLFAPGAAQRFPAWESDVAERSAHDELFGDRLRALKRLRQWCREPPEPVAADRDPELDRLWVTSILSLMQTVPDQAVIDQGTRSLRVGTRVDWEDLRRWLVTHGFQNTTGVELPGEFSARGGIVDLFAADWDWPVRVELFGDTIESIRRFDTATQRSVEAVDRVEITALRPDVGGRSSFFDYVPAETWFLMREPAQVRAEADACHTRLESTAGWFSPLETHQRLLRFPLAAASSIADLGGPCCRLQVESVERFSGEIARVRDELDRCGEDQDVLLVASTESEQDRLREIFAPSRLMERGRLHLLVGSLSAGFRLIPERAILVSGAELFQREDLRRIPRRRIGKPIDSFLDLREGDLVVHLAHGIGRYRGMRMVEKQGRMEEHLRIEFHGGAHIYVPALRIGLVQKYVGGTKTRPALARIGSKSWLRQKAAAESAVTDLAGDMLEMQAQRHLRPGIAFPADSDWQQAFDTSFAYQETDDQLASIEAIKHDMRQPRPMDRLLCGDVGYGKTEIAMRAAFKAVDSGYQVAVLVPTTILAEQHFRTFTQRMAEFPFDIVRLSRFCTPREQREIAQGLARGRIDIVIGTHRLASDDIQFHNLGLVIIDEEQRFGVEVKERLKRLRSTVDVLTMTATPIPRTLHMSLVGVRDISNLETPPDDRLAVETRVTRFDPALIRHAVLRELNRGGQIFFVHNRVHDIEQLAQRLQCIVPEASLRIGHGQMPEGELEQVMIDFVLHKFDLLLATTIVESGLDIPNANTIFIDDAHRYGLADLHQLRGRVGRYKHHAYCYLLVDPATYLTPNATRRLRAIEEFSDMGAGFAIAMRDLEIRGAGNLLGTQQSGHIAAVGYELYCQLLEAAVRRAKQLPAPVSIDVTINLPGQAFFPPQYVPGMRFKIDLYRRLARVCDADQLGEFKRELQDRFGPPPRPVRRLLELAELRIEAALWQISAVYVEDTYLVFRFHDRRRIEQLARHGGGRLRVVDTQSAYLPVGQEVTDPEKILARAKSVLRPGP
jgi:transcription-repair coupling factor (superfamily II helicase)